MAATGAFNLATLPPGWTPYAPERIQSSLSDTNKSTQQTVERMCGHIKDAQKDSLIQRIAQRTNGAWANGEQNQIAWDVFWFCKHKVRFIPDERAMLALYGTDDDVDFLVSPPVLMRMNRPAGDCDDFTMLACALLALNNVAWEIVTIKADPTEPGRWSHVYLRAVLENGRRLVLDPTNGTYPGWEVPSCDVFRKQVWDMNGRPIADSAPMVARMRGYVRGMRGLRGVGRYVRTAGLSGRRGMGQSGEVDVEGSGLPGGTVVSEDPTGTIANITLPSGSIVSANPPSSINWGTIFNNVISGGFKLGQEALLPAGSSLTAQGAIISPYGSAGSLLTGTGSLNLGTILLWGGIAFIGVMALGSLSGGRR